MATDHNRSLAHHKPMLECNQQLLVLRSCWWGLGSKSGAGSGASSMDPGARRPDASRDPCSSRPRDPKVVLYFARCGFATPIVLCTPRTTLPATSRFRASPGAYVEPLHRGRMPPPPPAAARGREDRVLPARHKAQWGRGAGARLERHASPHPLTSLSSFCVRVQGLNRTPSLQQCSVWRSGTTGRVVHFPHRGLKMISASWRSFRGRNAGFLLDPPEPPPSPKPSVDRCPVAASLNFVSKKPLRLAPDLLPRFVGNFLRFRGFENTGAP